MSEGVRMEKQSADEIMRSIEHWQDTPYDSGTSLAKIRSAIQSLYDQANRTCECGCPSACGYFYCPNCGGKIVYK